MIKVRETQYFKEWIRSLNDKVSQSIINARIRRLSGGNFGDTKAVGENVSELRIEYGPGFRVYFTRYDQEIIILLCGGNKSTQAADISTAQQLARNLEEI
ncbi:MAG: type II toxin-antitoxin system RelE/ParE family toxin [Treponema sp.]|nr:type II toxin-antitoxin system RelE/ParE family toxin [Treponema sp.]